MLVYKSDKNYCVHLKEDGDDLWVTVTDGYCRAYDCIVGRSEDGVDIKTCIDTAYSEFYPAQYVAENLESTANSFRVLCVARDAYEIERALEMAMSA